MSAALGACAALYAFAALCTQINIACSIALLALNEDNKASLNANRLYEGRADTQLIY